jgi:hypothetical protein
METKWVWSFFVQLTIKASLREEAYWAWQHKTWAVLHDAAKARYEENRQNLKERLATLLEEIGSDDALTLRKIEREEIMKGVLRWLFGPTFDFVPAVPDTAFAAADMAVGPEGPWKQGLLAYSMSAITAQGAMIKLLHHAIEWDNMLYFLYPYFWSYPSRWEFKKYLNHPDPMHRVFLKSGSARVVLTIRPGFEKAFVSFLESGTFAPLAADHPYFKITEEMEAYAKTNYPGIKPANPVEDARPLLMPLQRRTWQEMQEIMALLEEYRAANGAYPTTAEGLGALAAFGTVPAADPWGNPYVYGSPGVSGDYDLASFGADGLPGGEDADADISSWAEASLIGRWYEYTPTPALDIAFNETLPSA